MSSARRESELKSATPTSLLVPRTRVPAGLIILRELVNLSSLCAYAEMVVRRVSPVPVQRVVRAAPLPPPLKQKSKISISMGGSIR